MAPRSIRVRLPRISGLPAPARLELLPHQLPAKEYLRARRKAGKGGSLYMRMRLGKTVVMCDFITGDHPNDTNVVVCPKNVIPVWVSMLNAFGVKDVVTLEGTLDSRVQKMISTEARWYVVNYEMIEKLEIHKYSFDNLIFDESIRLANFKAKVTQYCLKYARTVPFIYHLAGDPAPDNVMQVFSQMLIMQGKFVGCHNYYQILNTHFEPVGYNYVAKEGTLDMITRDLHADCFVLTRLQAGFPDKTVYATRYVRMTDKQKSAYKEMLNNFEYNGVTTELHIVQANYLQQIAGGFDPTTRTWFSSEKLDDITYLLKTELRKDRVLIWCSHVHELDYLESELRERGIDIATISGDVPNSLREEIRVRFTEGKTRVVAATIDSIYQGGNWSSGSVCIFMSNVPSYNKRSQAQDRIYNITKDVPLLVIDLVTEGTVEQDLLNLLTEKGIGSNMLMNKMMLRIKDSKEAYLSR